jgi:hypothetical protein
MRLFQSPRHRLHLLRRVQRTAAGLSVCPGGAEGRWGFPCKARRVSARLDASPLLHTVLCVSEHTSGTDENPGNTLIMHTVLLPVPQLRASWYTVVSHYDLRCFMVAATSLGWCLQAHAPLAVTLIFAFLSGFGSGALNTGGSQTQT